MATLSAAEHDEGDSNAFREHPTHVRTLVVDSKKDVIEHRAVKKSLVIGTMTKKCDMTHPISDHWGTLLIKY